MNASIEKIIVGTAQLGMHYGIHYQGDEPTQERAFSLLESAYNNGIRTLDTAQAYGKSSEYIGAYHRSTEKRFGVMTKFKSIPPMRATDWLQETLHTLHLSALEACLFHSFEEYKHSPTLCQTAAQWKQQGRVRQLGVSVYTNQEAEAVLNDPMMDLIQLPYNLLDNANKRGKILQKAKQQGKTVHVRSVFLQGLFFMKEEEVPAQLLPLSKYLSAIRHKLASTEISLSALALNYALQNPMVDGVVLGVDSPEQLADNLKWIEANPQTLKTMMQWVDNQINVAENNLLLPIHWK